HTPENSTLSLHDALPISIGWAASKKTNSGSTPNSLKYPFSAPRKRTAEDVSLSTPSRTFCSAAPRPVAPRTAAAATSAASVLVARRTPSAIAASARWSRTSRRPMLSRIWRRAVMRSRFPGYRRPLEPHEEPVGRHAETREEHDAHHQLGRLHQVLGMEHQEPDPRVR